MAEVTWSNDSAFEITIERTLPVTPDEAYTRFTQISRWWSADHSYSGDAANFYLQPTAGGCWCENLPGGGSVEHMRVLHASPGKLLRLSGGLGPLQDYPLAAIMSVNFIATETEDEEAQTRITLIYRVSGDVEGGLAPWASGVEPVIAEAIGLFENYVRAEP